MNLAFWSKANWGCCVEKGFRVSVLPVQFLVQLYSIWGHRFSSTQIRLKTGFSGSFPAPPLAVLYWWHERWHSWREGTGHTVPLPAAGLYLAVHPARQAPWQPVLLSVHVSGSCLVVLKLMFLLLQQPAQGADGAEHKLVLYLGCSSGSEVGGKHSSLMDFFFF